MLHSTQLPYISLLHDFSSTSGHSSLELCPVYKFSVKQQSKNSRMNFTKLLSFATSPPFHHSWCMEVWKVEYAHRLAAANWGTRGSNKQVSLLRQFYLQRKMLSYNCDLVLQMKWWPCFFSLTGWCKCNDFWNCNREKKSFIGICHMRSMCMYFPLLHESWSQDGKRMTEQHPCFAEGALTGVVVSTVSLRVLL